MSTACANTEAFGTKLDEPTLFGGEPIQSTGPDVRALMCPSCLAELLGGRPALLCSGLTLDGHAGGMTL